RAGGVLRWRGHHRHPRPLVLAHPVPADVHGTGGRCAGGGVMPQPDHAQEENRLAEHFDRQRLRLRTLAYRMLGSTSEADDAVQDAWLRLRRAEISGIENLDAWLTTVVTRLCL